MRLNLLTLICNCLFLALVLGTRALPEPGGIVALLASLPWTSFGTELQDLAHAGVISAPALLAGWLATTGAWLLLSLLSWSLRRQVKTRVETSPARPGLSEKPTQGPQPAAAQDLPTDAEPARQSKRPGVTRAAAAPDDEISADLAALSHRLPEHLRGDLSRLQQALDRLSRS